MGSLFPALEDPAPPAAEGPDFGNPLFSRTGLAQMARIGSDAAKFLSRTGVRSGGIADYLGSAADAIEGTPEQGIAPDVVRGIASIPVAPFAYLSEAEQAAKSAEAHGASPAAALAIGTGVGLANGTLELMLPLGASKLLAKGTQKGLKSAAKNVAKGFGVESTTEGLQQVTQNAVPATYEGDVTRLGEGVPYAAGIGGLVGGSVGGVTSTVAADAAVPPPVESEVRPVAPTPEAEQAVLAQLPEDTIFPALSEAPVEAPSAAVEGVTPAEGAQVAPTLADEAQPVLDVAPDLAGAPPAAPTRGRLRRGGALTTPLIDRVERQGGEVGAEIATRGRLASDAAGALRGRWQVLTKPLRANLRGLGLKQRKARNELNKTREVPARDTSGPLASYEYSKFLDAVEHDEVLDSLSPAALAEVLGFREAMVQIGEDVSNVRTPEGGPVMMQTEEGSVPFRGAEGGRRLIRQWMPELWEIMQAGDKSQAFRALSQALAEANDMAPDLALEALNGIRQQVVERQSAVEVARTFKNFPSAMRMRDGRRVQLLQTDPMRAAESLVGGLALRVGYINQFGQAVGGESLGGKLREEFVKNGGEQADVDRMMQALQGMPTEGPSETLRPGTKAYDAGRAADAAITVGNSTLLTRAFVPNTFESVSKTPVVGSIRSAAKGYAQMARMLVDKQFRQDTLEDIESRGWHTVDMMDWMLTPGRKLESGARIVGQTLTAPAAKVNELNDIHAALTARDRVARLEAGKGTALDRGRLELLQFTPAQIETIMAGNPTPETAPLFNAVGRRIVSYSQGSTSMPAELSRAGNSRGYKRVVAFDRYAQFTANRTIRQMQAVLDATTPTAAARHTALLGQSIVGHAMAGAGAVMFGGLLKDGMVGLADIARGAVAGDDWEEKAKSFRTFLADAAQYAMLGGAADTIFKAAGSGSSSDAFRVLGSGTIPGRYTAEVIDWYNGVGRYKNKSSSDAALALLERNFPITPILRQVAAEVGLGGKDIRREVAIRRAWQFIRENQGVGSRSAATPPLDDEGPAKTRAFGIAMKRVEMAIRKGDTKAIPALRREALKAARISGKGARASLYGRRILPNIEVANREAARKWMGEKNWTALVQYDRLVEHYAKTLPTK